METEENTPEDENVGEKQSVSDDATEEQTPDTDGSKEEDTSGEVSDESGSLPDVDTDADADNSDAGGSEETPVTAENDAENTTDDGETAEVNMEEGAALNDGIEALSDGIKGELANGDVEVNELNFPDEVFRNYVSQYASTDTSGRTVLEFMRRSRVTEIAVINRNSDEKITSLEGIQYFPALTSLNCSYNEIEELDLTGLSNLKSLICYDNKITTLTLDGCTSLSRLACENNYITELNTNGITELNSLTCYNTNLSTLDVSENQNLQYLECGGNNLTSVKINDSIKSFCMYNSDKIEELDLSGCTQLENVNFVADTKIGTDAFAKMKTMDFTDCVSLKTISAANNSVKFPMLESIILSGTTSLTKLEIRSDNLTEIGLSDCVALTSLKIYDAPLTQLDLKAALFLEELLLTKESLAENFILYCWKYTVAEEYANSNGISYQADDYEKYATVTYVTNCEKTIDPKILISGMKLSEPTLSPSDGSKVVGWFTDSRFTQHFDFDNMTVTDDITLYAKLVSDDKIYINEENFPDEHFRNYLTGDSVRASLGIQSEMVLGSGGYYPVYYIGATARSKRISISLYNYNEGVESIKGIEYFEGLYSLNCSGKALTELDLSQNILLERVDCNRNALQKLILPESGELTFVECSDNELTALDVSKNPSLRSLSCSDNIITSLDLKNNKELKELYCYGNQLEQLDISANTELEKLYCRNNEKLSNLNFGSAAKLREFDCSNSNVETLDISNCSELTRLRCVGNNLSELDLRANSKLALLECEDNQLESLDLSSNSQLTSLSCNKNSLTALDLSKNTKLETLDCGNKELENLDISKCSELTRFYCTDSGLTFIDFRYNAKLTSLNLGYEYNSDSGFGNENLVLTGIDLRDNNCVINDGITVPDAVTIYCTEGTWIAKWCEKNHSNYSYNDPWEEVDPDNPNPPVDPDNPNPPVDPDNPNPPVDPDDPNPPVDPDSPAVDSNDLKDAVVTLTASYIKVKKNNAAQKPVPKKVTLNGKTLKKNTDYTISYTARYTENGVTTTKPVDALTTVGSYTMTLSAVPNGKYTGSASRTIVVTEKKLMSAVKVTVNKVDYTGNAIIGGVIKSVKDGKKELKEDTDYTVSYSNNTDSGKGTVILTAKPESEYAGTKEVLFDITGLKISKAKVTGVTAKDFNGSGNITQTIANGAQDTDGVKLTYNVKEAGATVTKTLTPGTDFTVTYEKNNAAGTAKIIFTGKGLYNGTLKKSFKINKVKLTDDMRDKTPISIAHTKGGAKPDVSITYNGVKLINGKDYTLSYKKNKAVSSDTNKPMITVKGKGSYSGTLKNIPFTIGAQAINNPAINITAADVAYSSKKTEYGTTIKIYDNGVKLSANKDYTIEDITGNQVAALPENGYQTATVTIRGNGNYNGTATVTFNIVEKLINGMSAKVTGVHVYRGTEVRLEQSEIVITDKKTGHILTADEFRIKGYSKNDRAGTASVEVQGLGRYGGTKVIKFKISK